MNILYIHTHDTGKYISPYGYNAHTPNLMGLAKEGTLFRQAYCTGPTCSPSRAGLLTGMAPHSCGMLGLAHRGFKLDDYNKHIVHFLNQNGYETALCGIQHEAYDDKTIGYTRILNKSSHHDIPQTIYDKKNAELAVQYINEKKDKPFFISYGLFGTHREFPEIDKNINPDYVMPPFPIADVKENRKDFASYLTSVKKADQNIGIVLSAIKEARLENNTMIIYTTDHGIAFPHMKCNLYDTGIGVSLIIKYPANKKQGEAVDSLVSHLDIFPTICDLLEIKAPDWLQGKSLLPIFDVNESEVRNEIFSEINFHCAYEPARSIRTKRYKLIRYFDDIDSCINSNVDDSYAKDFLLYNNYDQIKREKTMIFDLYIDPLERINLISNINYREVFVELNNRLKEWMKATNDPLCLGKIQKPEGTIVNRTDCISANEESFV